MVENDIPTVGVVNQPSLNTLNSVSKKIQIRTKSKILGVVREQYLRLRNSLLWHYTGTLCMQRDILQDAVLLEIFCK